jgi:hypothetical protein
MRILEQLNKYDENLTLFQVKTIILEEKQNEKQKEENEFQEIKNKFNNTYIKKINNDRIFGKTIEIYQIEEITGRERTTDWIFIYSFKGNLISFSKKYINYDENFWSFSKKELEQAEIINESQYNLYLNQYQEVENKFQNILDNE